MINTALLPWDVGPEWLYESPESTFGFTVPNAMRDGTLARMELVRDELGRIRTRDYPSEPDIQYGYDPMDRLI